MIIYSPDEFRKGESEKNFIAKDQSSMRVPRT